MGPFIPNLSKHFQDLYYHTYLGHICIQGVLEYYEVPRPNYNMHICIILNSPSLRNAFGVICNVINTLTGAENTFFMKVTPFDRVRTYPRCPSPDDDA